jgi:hypothetical protein
MWEMSGQGSRIRGLSLLERYREAVVVVVVVVGVVERMWDVGWGRGRRMDVGQAREREGESWQRKWQRAAGKAGKAGVSLVTRPSPPPLSPWGRLFSGFPIATITTKSTTSTIYRYWLRISVLSAAIAAATPPTLRTARGRRQRLFWLFLPRLSCHPRKYFPHIKITLQLPA